MLCEGRFFEKLTKQSMKRPKVILCLVFLGLFGRVQGRNNQMVYFLNNWCFEERVNYLPTLNEDNYKKEAIYLLGDYSTK